MPPFPEVSPAVSDVWLPLRYVRRNTLEKFEPAYPFLVSISSHLHVGSLLADVY